MGASSVAGIILKKRLRRATYPPRPFIVRSIISYWQLLNENKEEKEGRVSRRNRLMIRLLIFATHERSKQTVLAPLYTINTLGERVASFKGRE